MDENEESRPDEGLPGEPSHNREDTHPTDPERAPAGSPAGGDEEAGGESGEGSQSTGSPDAAG